MNSLKGFGRGLKEKLRRSSDASGVSSASDSSASTPSSSPGISSQLDSGFGNKTTSVGFGSDPSAASEERVRKNQIASKSTHEQLEAMRWLVAESNNKSKASLYLNTQSRNAGNGDASNSESDGFAETFLPSVVKLLATKHPELKRLVYIFLVRHAESKPDDALMSVNEIQKGLNDSNNAQSRILSIRVLSSIRVQDIVPITLVVVKNAVFDPNPMVRKAGVLGILKLYSFNPDMEEDLFEILLKVLDSEPSPLVIGAACEAFNMICPGRLDAIHWSYRKICKMLADIDEWSQVPAVNILHRYARANFVNPNLKSKPSSGKVATENGKENNDAAKGMKASVEDFYGDNAKTTVDGSEANAQNARSPEEMITDDHRLLLRCSWPLLQSRNSSVLMGVAALQFDFAPSYEHHRCAKALMFCLRSTRSASEYVILNNVSSFAYRYPDVFAPHFAGFFVRANDPPHVKCLKLDIMTEIIQEGQVPDLLKELQAYLRDNDMSFVSKAVFALGRCAQKFPKAQERILKSLMALSTHTSEAVSSNSVQVILGIAQEDPALYIEQIAKLIKRYTMLTSPKARMGVLWLSSCHLTLHSRIGKSEEEVQKQIGEETFKKLSELAYEAARLATLEFIGEVSEVKLQILNSFAKLHIHGIDKVKTAFEYVLKMANCDASYSVRDRARLYAGLTSTETGMVDLPLSKNIILASEHLKPVSSGSSNARSTFSIGSLSHLVNHCAPGYQSLASFRETPTSSNLRDGRSYSSNKVQSSKSSFNGQKPSRMPEASSQPSNAMNRNPLESFYSDAEEDSEGYSDSYSYSYSETEEDDEPAAEEAAPPVKEESKEEDTVKQEDEDEDEEDEESGFFLGEK
jgi:AP-3 complex subunit beta